MEPPEYQPWAQPDPFAPPGEPVAAPSARSRIELTLALVIATVLLAGVAGLFVKRDEGAGAPVAVGCGEVRDFPLPLDAAHAPGRVEYPAEAPYGGQHNPVPLPGRVRYWPRQGAPDIIAERAVHNLEHAYVVVWYDAGATDDSLTRLRGALDAAPPKVIAVPWRGEPGDGPHFWLAAWGHLQACEQPTLDAITAFYDAYGGPNGDAPEKNAI